MSGSISREAGGGHTASWNIDPDSMPGRAGGVGAKMTKIPPRARVTTGSARRKFVHAERIAATAACGVDAVYTTARKRVVVIRRGKERAWEGRTTMPPTAEPAMSAVVHDEPREGGEVRDYRGNDLGEHKRGR